MVNTEKLLAEAKKAAKNSYSPYSGLRVGAALETKSGRIFTGSNVENSSYGLTNCAERTAIFKAVSEGERDFIGMVIYSDTDRLFYPCGACRQVMAEFGDELSIVIISNRNKAETSLSQLLPSIFRL
ncbi:MAG: cytidine deaminase [Candidatus Cloacimonetes bacterium]|nr:cytidine deaminase [Candidatus Cloacimonadota bacterium]